MKCLAIGICALLVPSIFAQTATYTSSNQNVVLTGLGGSNGIGQSSVQWGNCVYDGASKTNCTVTAPYTGVGGGGTISIVFSYPGSGKSPFLANSITAGSNLVSFALAAGSSGSVTVSLQENTGQTVTFLTNNFTFYYTGATCSGTAVSACAIGTVGLTPGAVMSGPVYGTFDQTPVIRTSQGVISASAYGAFSALAPGTWMEIYGTNLANVTSATWSNGFVGNQAPTNVGQTTVTIGGQAAFIDYVSPTQVNAQVPSNVATGSQQVVVTTPGGTSAPYTITVNPTEPGLLAPAVFGTANGNYIGAVFSNGTTFVLPPGMVSGVTSQRAQVGNEIVFFGVGFGPVTPAIPAGQIVTQTNALADTLQIYFNGVPATVEFAGLTGGFLGLYQFNVVVPNIPASDTVPVTFTLNGAQGSQTLLIPVAN
jgi:uncharacterized protein (TIGR03437 family)